MKNGKRELNYLVNYGYQKPPKPGKIHVFHVLLCFMKTLATKHQFLGIVSHGKQKHRGDVVFRFNEKERN